MKRIFNTLTERRGTTSTKGLSRKRFSSLVERVREKKKVAKRKRADRPVGHEIFIKPP